MSNNLKDILKKVYERGKTDYWVPPLVVHSKIGRIKAGDTVFCCLRRGEREIQLTEAFVERGFEHFPRQFLEGLLFVPMTQYHEKFSHLPTVFPPITPVNTLGEVLSRHGKKQLALSESEKQAHVTYFFNGRTNETFPGQEAKILPSYRNYEEHPEMKSRELAAELVNFLEEKDFIVVNFPAGDVIGHLEDWELKVKTIEVVDEALGLVMKEAQRAGYRLIITADHGLIEQGRDEKGEPSIGHTTAKVPMILVDPVLKLESKLTTYPCSLADVAPTILRLMNVPVPIEMTGAPLVKDDLEPSKVLLVILDGWGLGKSNPEVNPIKAAHTPVFDSLLTTCSVLELEASGLSVGLPEGNSGNSETGHLTLGAGRVIEQDGLRVAKALESGFENNEVLTKALQRTLENNAALHLISLLSEGSSHGSIQEMLAIASLARGFGIPQIFFHIILDGRSAPPYGAMELLEKYELLGAKSSLVTIVGRGFALDRAKDYRNRTKLAYDALVKGIGTSFCF